MLLFWDSWNRDHIAKHGVSVNEAAYVVAHARAPYPADAGDDKFCVRGSTPASRVLQVIFVYRPVETIALDELPPHERLELAEQRAVLYVIHARDLKPGEKRRLRRRRG